MNNMRLLTSIGGIDDDLIVRAGTDIMASQIKKDKKKTKPWIKASTIAACLALALCFGYFSGLFGKLLDPAKPEFPDALENMIWAPHGSTSEIVDGFTEWNGLTVKMSLKNALEDTDNAGKYFAVVISKKDRSDMDSFVYNGKTYKALTDEIEQNKAEFYKLSTLEKEGLLLCWGETLYTTGIPADVPVIGGEKWARALYDERVSYYGDELLSKYIHEGKFEAADIAADIKNTCDLANSLSAEYEELWNEYNKQSSVRYLGELQEKNKNICIRMYNGYAVLFVTADELSGVKLSKLSECVFALYSRVAPIGGLLPDGGDIPDNCA